MENADLIRVFSETLEDILAGDYINEKDEVQDLSLKALKKGSKFYLELRKIPQDKIPHYDVMKVYVENTDTFKKAIEFGSKGACLNMASNYTPGGGVRKGSRAQEESLCRRSTLISSLYSFTDYGKTETGWQNTKESGRYPIPTYGGIYSPGVMIFRNSDYTYMEKPEITNVISVAAVNRPKLDESGRIAGGYVAMTKGKIRAILRIAILNGHSKLVLGAFGCGAYQNPASHVAELFKLVLEEPEFNHSFEEVCFAILDDKNAKRQNNKDGNFKPFADMFGI